MAGKKKNPMKGKKKGYLAFLPVLAIMLLISVTRSEAAEGWSFDVGPYTPNFATPTAYIVGKNLSYTGQGISGMTLARLNHADKWVADIFTPQGFGALSSDGAGTAVLGVELINLLGIRVGGGYSSNNATNPDGSAPGHWVLTYGVNLSGVFNELTK